MTIVVCKRTYYNPEFQRRSVDIILELDSLWIEYAKALNIYSKPRLFLKHVLKLVLLYLRNILIIINLISKLYLCLFIFLIVLLVY